MNRRFDPRDAASSYAALVGGFYLVYAILSLLLTGRTIGPATGNSLWIFTVSPITGVLALAAALVAIPVATRPPLARRFALAAGVGFIAWGIACVATGDSGDPAFAGTTANVTLYLVTGALGVAAAFAPPWLMGGHAKADTPGPEPSAATQDEISPSS